MSADRTGQTPRRPAAAVVLVLLSCASVVAACSTGGGEAADPQRATSVTDRLPRSPIAGEEGAWRLDVTDAPVSSRSSAQVANLAQQVRSRYGGVAAFNSQQYTVAYYRVGRDVPRQDVVFDDCQGKGSTPPELYDRRTGPFRSVPIPADAVPSAGTDSELAVHSPSTDQLWDFWKARKVGSRWHACWGGRIDDFSTSAGYFPGFTGATASGLAVESGLLGLREVKSGAVRHALTLGLPEITQEVSYPAQRSDGIQPAGASGGIPMGTRFRLDPSVDIDSLDLTPVAKVVAHAAQRYGFIVTDTSGAVSLQAERGSARSSAWTPLLRGVPGYAVLKDFPWDRLQALPVDYGKP